jgi:hypothetical protein
MQKAALYSLSVPTNGHHRNQINPRFNCQNRPKYLSVHIETFGNQKNLTSYITFVNKGFSKPDNIIKLLQLPDKEFA